MLRKVDVILMNREEASLFTGVGYEDEKGIFRKFDELVKGIAVMTDGKKGVLASDGKKIFRAGTFKEKKVMDRTGAGDAFGSGFVSVLARKKEWSDKDIAEAIRVGTANATSVVEHIGAEKGIIRRHDLSDPRWKKLTIQIKNI
jgi:sugar/nucleoside kinase (ribokinase family)